MHVSYLLLENVSASSEFPQLRAFCIWIATIKNHKSWNCFTRSWARLIFYLLDISGILLRFSAEFTDYLHHNKKEKP